MRPVIEEGLAVRCASCGEDMRWEGKGRKSYKACGCIVPEPIKAAGVTAKAEGRRKCSKRGSKAKGDGEERAIVKAFEAIGWNAYRTAGSGAHGSRVNEQAFATDVRVKFTSETDDIVLRIESKRHASIAGIKTMNALRDNSEILWMRQDFDEPYVFMPASVLMDLIARVK